MLTKEIIRAPKAVDGGGPPVPRRLFNLFPQPAKCPHHDRTEYRT